MSVRLDLSLFLRRIFAARTVFLVAGAGIWRADVQYNTDPGRGEVIGVAVDAALAVFALPA